MPKSQPKVQIEISKVLQVRDDWALVKFRSVSSTGVCGGTFHCPGRHIVAGQVYKGHLRQKRRANGQLCWSFKGVPANAVGHRAKFALDAAGVNLARRKVLFETFKPIAKLFKVIEAKRWTSLTSLQQIGKSSVTKIQQAYETLKPFLQRSQVLSREFPTLSATMSAKQTEEAMAWMKMPDESPMAAWCDFIREDPFRIIYHTEFDSFLFQENSPRARFLAATTHKSRVKMAEAVAKDLKIPTNDSRRQRYKAIEYVLKHIKQTGDYWMPLRTFRANFHTVDARWPFKTYETYITLTKYADIERFIEKEFEKVQLCEQPAFALPDDSVLLDATQREAVKQACENPLFVLHGGAGVGKTSVCEHIVASLHGAVTCAAPTGKAAQRLKEMTGAVAHTVHRLYYAESLETHPTLLLDEQSMQDLEILAKLLSKRTFHKIIFVGDTGQLTSVGPGQFLKDLCASDVPSIELTKIYRSGSFVASNGNKIRHGDTNLDTSPDSFEVIPYTSDQKIVEKSVEILRQTGCRPIVLCNTNKETANLNIELRKKFNPPEATHTSVPINLDYVSDGSFRYPGWRFAVGDSVINVTNKYKEVRGGENKVQLQVANGDIGSIVRITSEHIFVQYDTMVKYEGVIEYCEYLRPAYALTVNKAQGSEYDFVIVKSVSSWGDKRERLYTAITRAKKKCIIYEVGSANDDCIRAAPSERKTFLFKQ